jgi:hypothetical protein
VPIPLPTGRQPNAGLLYFLSPTADRSDQVHLYIWLIGIGANLALVVGLVLWGRRGPAGQGGGTQGSSAQQAAIFGVAAGSAFGLTAALMKGMTTYFSQGDSGRYSPAGSCTRWWRPVRSACSWCSRR